ncbi:MAG: ATP-binding protein [Acidimicrobiia bacterium]
MTASESLATVFAPTPASGREARKWLRGALRRWGYDARVDGALIDDALLCTAELATNAVLHSRSPFQVFARTSGERLHVEVIDDRPNELPVPVPLVGSAADITASGTTGRGLQIVAALSRRWGVTTSDGAKAVWAELEPGTSAVPTEPVVVLGHRAPPVVGGIRLDLQALPVRTTVASAIQLEELVREIQLSGPGGTLPGDEVRFYDLLDRSAPPRLTGRHAAMRAAAVGRRRFDLVLDASPASLFAARDLSRLLRSLAHVADGTALPARDDAVADLWHWLEREGESQVRGNAPVACPLPD